MKLKTVNLIIPAQERIKGTMLFEINLCWTEQMKPSAVHSDSTLQCSCRILTFYDLLT